MSHKRRGDDDGLDRRAAGGDKRRSSRRRKHLYLVLDDWDKGFSIHKIDADAFDSSSDDDQYHHSGAARHLPEPPALRIESPAGSEPHGDMSFAALGTKMFFLMDQRCGLVYDAETAALSVGAHAPAQMVCSGYVVSLAVGEVLYMLTFRRLDKENPHSFEAMSWAPTAAPDAMHPHPAEGWSWKTLPPPAFHSYVQSYALHPDGRTIFMTSSDDRGRMGTYSFDVKDSSWKFHGRWVLPFLGQGHYDSELDAWVGLALDHDGYICCCQPVSPSFQLPVTAPCFYVDCKTTKEKMFQEAHDSHLTYMGASRFCIVKCMAAKNAEKRPPYGARIGHVIHLTIFGLKYNHRGELHTKDHQSTRSFLVSSHSSYRPHAFWM